MKAIKLSLVAVVIALGTFAAFAFTPEKTESKTTTTSLYWFRDGALIGHGDVSITGCPNTGSVICAEGYSSIDENGEPVGTPIYAYKPL